MLREDLCGSGIGLGSVGWEMIGRLWLEPSLSVALRFEFERVNHLEGLERKEPSPEGDGTRGKECCVGNSSSPTFADDVDLATCRRFILVPAAT